MSRIKMLYKAIALALSVLLLAGCGGGQANAMITGQVTYSGERASDQPPVSLVIPCLITEEGACQVDSESLANVSENGAFEIAGIAPGTYTFLYGPADAESKRSLWEGKEILLDSPEAFAQSFDPGAEAVGCRYLETASEPDEETGLYPITIFETVWVEEVSLLLDVPGGFEWTQGAVPIAGTGAPLQVEVMAGETVSVTLHKIACKSE